VRENILSSQVLLTNISEMKNWFEKELAELNLSPLVKLTIYVTRTLNARARTGEKQSAEQAIIQASSFEKPDADISDPEKAAVTSGSCSPTTPESTVPIILGRPDISSRVRDVVSATGEPERTIVAACGPESLMNETRSVVGELVKSSERSVTLHCEQFGW
jgi:hypothetical protein